MNSRAVAHGYKQYLAEVKTGGPMGLGRKLVRRAVPRSARRASRIAYTITNPLGAAQNGLINSMMGKTAVSGSGIRAEAGADSFQRIAELMLVGREKFVNANRPQIPEPKRSNPAIWYREEWQRRKHEARFWQRSKIKELKSQVSAHAEIYAEGAFADGMKQYQSERRTADAWWQQLIVGEPKTLKAALQKGFSDNFAAVRVIEAEGSEADLSIRMPAIDILPDKRMNITPTGRLSSKAWTKTELNEAYAQLLAAHLLATVREAWAVGLSLQKLRIVALPEFGEINDGFLFDIDAIRALGDWHDDGWGEIVLKSFQLGLNRVGKTREIQLWPVDRLRAYNS